MKRKLIYNGRKKALLGMAESTAIMAAAVMGAGATAAAAKLNADSAEKAAKQQADATRNAAQQQANALKAQSENANTLQKNTIDFNRQIHQENMQTQKDMQMTLQRMAGLEDEKAARRAGNYEVRNGGSTNKIKRNINKLSFGKRKKLINSINSYNKGLYDDVDMELLTRVGLIDDYNYGYDEMFKPNRLTAKYGKSFLRGSDNMPFHITDGGGVIPVGVTPEGFELYELYGNDHNHYHKAQGGKNKTGVGIKFGNGAIIEGEGNQKSNNGELLLTTPEGGYFISKHSINGFNPAEAVKQGMHPAVAFQTQELIKDMTGISDDGKHNSTPVKKRKLRLAGGEAENIMTQYFPQGMDFSTDISIPAASGIMYSLQNQDNRPKSKNGCSTKRTLGRRKAVGGYGVAALNDYQVSRLGMPNINVPSINTNGVGGSSNWLDNNAQFIGAGINTLGNIGGALLTNWGNNRAANVLAEAYGQAADITADAYSRMTGIDMSNIKREDYSAAHYLPVVRRAYFNANPQLAKIDRNADIRRKAIKRNSLSSAAMLSRLASLDAETIDNRNAIYADKYNREEQINQGNAERITDAAEINAKLDSQANRDYANAYLNLLQYNNDINNEKLAGIAQARSAGITNAAGVRASTRQANANAWANAISQSGLAFGNAFAVTGKQIQDKNNVMLGADNDAYFRNLWMHGSASEKAAAKAKLSELINRTSGKTREQYQTWYDMMG